MRHVMVATDGSKGTNRAVDVAAELTKALITNILAQRIEGFGEAGGGRGTGVEPSPRPRTQYSVT